MNIALQLLPAIPALLAAMFGCVLALTRFRTQRSLAALVFAASCLWMVVTVLQVGFWVLVDVRNLMDPANAGANMVFAIATGFSVASLFPWLVVGGAAIAGRGRPK